MGAAASVPSSNHKLRRIAYVKLFLATQHHLQKPHTLREHLLALCSKCDSNGDGYLSTKEIVSF